MAWVVGFLNEGVKASLDALPLDIRASFQRIAELIQAHGLERVREPYVKHLEGALWEMRMKGKSGIARACRTWTPHPGVTICPRMPSTHSGIGRGHTLGSMRFSIRCGRLIEIRHSWRR